MHADLTRKKVDRRWSVAFSLTDFVQSRLRSAKVEQIARQSKSRILLKNVGLSCYPLQCRKQLDIIWILCEFGLMPNRKSGRSVKKDANADEQSSRKYLVQTDVPAFSLEEALRVPRALSDDYGKNPTKPLRVAQALNLAPNSSTFRMLAGAAIAYGLTDGGSYSELISLTPLGRRIVAPTHEDDDQAALREATLRPRVFT